MPKFHDEFFKKGSSEHDNLIYKILQNPKQIFKKYVETRSKDDTELVCVCDHSQKPKFCNSIGDIAWMAPPKCGNLYKNNKEEISAINKCKHLDANNFIEEVSDFENDINPVYDIIASPRIYKRKIIQMDSETEKICKSGNSFIIGYADIVFTFVYSFTIDLQIRDGFIWKNWKEDDWIDLTIVVDAKPELKSWGGPLRQIKTYMDCLRADYGFLVSYDSIPEEHKKILKKERVGIITIDKEETDTDKKLGDYF